MTGRTKIKMLASPLTMLVALLLVTPVTLVACGDEEEERSILDSRNDDNDNQQNNQSQDPGYEAGVLDGYWELSWDNGEHFSSFTIVHNLDEETLSGTFDTNGGGSGNIRTINFNPEIEVGDERAPGRLTAEWRPHPDNPDSNEEYTITSAYFAEGGTEDRMIGEISAIASFDVRMFNMERADPPEDHGEEDENQQEENREEEED